MRTGFKRHMTGWLLALVPLIIFLQFLNQVTTVASGETLSWAIHWFSLLKINLAFRLDGLSLLFALIISGIAMPIIIYSAYYLDDETRLPRYYCYLLAFMFAMLGLVLADDLIALFLFWELTTIFSYLLIGFNHQASHAREAAKQALFVTGAGGLCLLLSFILIGATCDTFSISSLIWHHDVLLKSHYHILMLVLLLIGAFTKSAQFPFHFWLADAMEAPTSISAYLHSATMVKAGIYLLARFHPVFSQEQFWFIALSSVGGATMLVGAWLAIKQTDMKLLLAYSTVTALGSLVFLLGSPHDMVIKAAVAFLVAHAFYKATLFMAVGDIQHQAGSRDLREISGLLKAMPITFAAILISGASMMGLPPLLGFYVKELIYEANLAAPIAAEILTLIAVFSNMVVGMLALMLLIKPFKGKQRPAKVLEANYNMSINAVLLALMMLILSLFPFLIDRTLLSPAASAILAKEVTLNLTLWHGFTPSLLLSSLTLLGAILFYVKHHRLVIWHDKLKFLYQYGPQNGYRVMMDGLVRFSVFFTEFFQNGKLQNYFLIIFIALSGIIWAALLNNHFQILHAINWHFEWDLMSGLIFLWLILSAFLLIYIKKFFTAIICLGFFGIGNILFFLINAAPDLALTQALIETLTLVMAVLAFRHLSPSLPVVHSENSHLKWLNIFIAVSIGLFVTLLLIAVTQTPFNASVGQYFTEHSLSLGHGRNVVNVIIVDFRAFDTFGEIMVILLAALGIAAIKKSIR